MFKYVTITISSVVVEDHSQELSNMECVFVTVSLPFYPLDCVAVK